LFSNLQIRLTFGFKAKAKVEELLLQNSSLIFYQVQ